MSGIELFKIWAPEGLPWSAWAKPVLFANAYGASARQESMFEGGGIPIQPGVKWPEVAVPARRDVAIICELPEDSSVAMGIVLARKGFRPTPLFNCATGMPPAIQWQGIVRLLQIGAEELKSISIPVEAPPVFLLDSKRKKPMTLAPGTFDNRWVVFAQDFPSAGFLQAHGIRTVLLAQENASFAPQEDLAHVLLRWQQAGLEVVTAEPPDLTQLRPLTIRKPSNFRSLIYRVMVGLGLRRNSAGGFGGVVPEPSSGG